MQPLEAEQIRIYVEETSQYQGKPVHEALLDAAREQGIEGATVYRGVISYGKDKEVRTSRILRLSERLPLIVEMIDLPEKIATFLPVLEEIVPQGLVTVQSVRMFRIDKPK